MSQIVDSRTIRESGNYNLSVKSDEVDKLIDQAIAETDKAKRDELWAQIDKKVMEEASVLPDRVGQGAAAARQGRDERVRHRARSTCTTT